MGKRGLLFIGLFFIVIFLLGTLCLSVTKKRKSISGALLWGFALVLALLQLLGYPMMQLNLSFRLFFWCFTILLTGIIIYATYRLFSQGEIRQYQSRALALFREACTVKLLLALLLLVFALCLHLSLDFQYNTSDGSFYIPRAALKLSTNQLQVSYSMAWAGEEIACWPHVTDPSTLEIFYAYLSFVTGIPVGIFCKVQFAAAALVIGFVAIYALAGQLLSEQKNNLKSKAFLLLIYLLITILGTAYTDLASQWICRFPWQGKSMLLSFIYPMIFLACAQIIQNDRDPIPWADWGLVTLVLTAGVSVSSAGVFFPFILYSTLGLSYLVLYRRKDLLRLLPGLLVSILSVIIFGGLTLLEIVTRNSRYLSIPIRLNWGEIFQGQLGPYHYFFAFLYAAGLVYVALKGNRTLRLLFIGGPIALFLTFLNPLLIEVVSKYVTTGSIYWRLYWMFPLTFAPALALADGVGEWKMERLNTALMGAMCMILLTIGYGSAINGAAFKDSIKGAFPIVNLTEKENSYGLPGAVVEVCDSILWDYEGSEPPRLLTTDESMVFFRQYTTDIVLAGGVRPEMRAQLTIPVEGTNELQSDFYAAFEQGRITDGDYFIDRVNRMGIDYICEAIEFPQIPEMAKAKLELITETTTEARNYELWKVR